MFFEIVDKTLVVHSQTFGLEAQATFISQPGYSKDYSKHNSGASPKWGKDRETVFDER